MKMKIKLSKNDPTTTSGLFFAKKTPGKKTPNIRGMRQFSKSTMLQRL